MRRLNCLKDFCFGTLLLELISSTIQSPTFPKLEGIPTLDIFMGHQTSGSNGILESHFSEVKSQLEGSLSRSKRKSQFISDPSSETHLTKKVTNDRSPEGPDKALEMSNEDSSLDFLSIHLAPHHWLWEGQQMNRQTLSDIQKTRADMERLGKVEVEGAQGSRASNFRREDELELKS